MTVRTRIVKLVGAGLGLAAVASLIVGVPVVAGSRASGQPRALQLVSNVIATPVPNRVAAFAKYTVTYRAGAALTVGKSITIRFPAGTIVPAASSFSSNITVNGLKTYALSTTASNVIVRNPAPYAAGANVAVVLGSSSPVIKNPAKPGSYRLDVRTQTEGFGASAPYSIVANAAPTASGQSVTTDEDTAKTITLEGSDADGDALTFSIVGGPANGSLGPIGAPACGGTSCSANVTYTPNANFNGADGFQFRVSDGLANSAAAAVDIAVSPVNDSPNAVDDAATVDQDSGANAIAVLTNDSDADGDSLTIASTTNGAHGTVAITGGGAALEYTPAAGFHGSDSFTYTVGDGHGGSDTATVFVTVIPPGGPTTFELCAKTGSATLTGSVSVAIWGFALGDCDAAGPATLPGPLLGVNEGDAVTIVLDNSLGQNVSLVFPGQDLVPDAEGVASGERSYTFTARAPGTYLYESGVNAARQVSMGLYGALVVRPTSCADCAYGPQSPYDAEAVLVLSEVDPLFNADPTGFNLRNYRPKYWLINGKAHPDTPSVLAGPGEKVLLRYVNAGLLNHTMTLLGTHQRVIAKDAFAAPIPFDVVAETIPSGSTADMIATIPSGAASGTRLPLYNRQLHLTNAGSFPGGMLTFLQVP